MRKQKILGMLLFAGLLVGTASGQSANQQLFDAIKARKLAGVQASLANGADVNAKDSDRSTPLINAAFYGPKDIVELLIAKGADVKAKSRNGSTALNNAALSAGSDVDASAIVELLIAKGADVYAREDSGSSALDTVSLLPKTKETEAIRAVLAAAMPNSIKSPAESALIQQLFAAINAGDTVKIGEIIGKGANPNAMFGDSEGTSLNEAACVGVNQKAIVEILLAHGADVIAEDKYGNSPLNRAAGCTYKKDLKDVVELLIAKGANANTKDREGEFPLHSASEAGNRDVAELLIAKGADVNAKDKDGDTPLHDVAMHPGVESQYHLITWLIAKGADVNAKNNKGETPLQAMDEADTKGMLCLIIPSYLIDKDCTATRREVAALLQAEMSKGLNPQDSLKAYLVQFKGHSGNEDVSRSIIDMALAMRPAPVVPAEAEAAAGRGTYIFKNANSQDELLSAAKEYLAAIEAAPWVADYYFNLCTVLEKTSYTAQALHACKLYLVASPNATDAGGVRQRIAGLQYAADKDKAQMKQRTRYIKDGGTEDLYRFGGISGTVSGREIVLKLFTDWAAAPPKYQVYAGCSGGPGEMYGDTHDLVSTDTWTTFCNPVVQLHLVIKPEGEGFVQVNDSNGGSVRGTLDELFEAKEKTMAQAVIFSANSDQGDQFYVSYAQGGNGLKYAGYAMYGSDCNGSLLKKDARALPDAFVSLEQKRAEGFGRFSPEINSFSGLPLTDVCSRQFSSKTGYHFGETE